MNANYNVWIENKKSVVVSAWRVALLQAVAKTGAISGAAKKLRVSEGTARERIREIETGLGAKVVEPGPVVKGRKTLQLTPRGTQLVERFATFSAGLDEEIARRYKAAFSK